jgi:hypothetical protein
MGIKDLDTAVNEMDVQDRYRVAFRNAFKDIIFESNYNTDGIAYSKSNKLTMIVEQKYGYNFMNLKDRARVVSQVIKYVKNIHDTDATKVPKVAVIGDENETFVLPVSDIINYISIKDYQWELSPSSMYKDEVLINDLIEDEIVRNLYIYNPNNEFREIVNKIKEVNKGISVPRTLTEKNIDRVFEYFCDKITMKIGRSTVKPNDMVNLFAHIMIHPDSVELKGNKLLNSMFKDPIIIGNVDNYNGFIREFSRKYTPKQKRIFTGILDRLIEDTTRRFQGEFFTPVDWVDIGHKYIEDVIPNWKEDYVVWDPAWGTGNLTRDYKFKELYASTLNQSDIDTANQVGHNDGAIKFQYDLLNDDYEKLPKGLRNAIEGGRKIIVLMNPPYATANNLDNKIRKNSNKSEVSFTKVGYDMKKNGLDKSSRQLYAQFFYQINKITSGNVIICQYTQPTFMLGESYTTFRDKILSKYDFKKGFLFNGKHFSDTKGVWSISFTIFEGNKLSYSDKYLIDIMEKSENGVFRKGQKYLKPVKNKLSDWVREEIKDRKKDEKILLPHVSSALTISEKSHQRELKEGYLGSYVGLSNNVSNNTTGVGLFSTTPTQGNASISLSIFNDNFDKMVTAFSARKLIISTWDNFKDEYSKPNKTHEEFEQFKYDSIVYSLFNSHSQQSSLRQITYKDKLWDIKNEFFWMSKNRIAELANENYYDKLYCDVDTSTDRYVYKLLFGKERIYDKLSDDAKAVLDKATELVEKSMKIRQEMSNDENHLDSWDAGYAQLKLVWKEYFEEDFKEFRQLYKNLEDRMRPLVYELGFLMK